MISLDQVQMLEKSVAAMVAKMNELQKQNSFLKEQNEQLKATLGGQNERLKEENEKLFNDKQALMHKISSFEADQTRIEQGILNAIDRLNSMENNANKPVTLHSENHSQPVSSSEATAKSIVTAETSEPQVKPVENASSAGNETKTVEEAEKDSEVDFEFGLDLNFEDEADPDNKQKMDIF